MSNKTTGGRLLAEMLQREGVDHLFGIIDGTYLQFFASGHDLGMRIITPRHEATALHAAGAYARMTGRLGVAMASNGPGVANALSGVAVEQGEGNRVLLITSSRRPQIAYPDRGGAYQCFDQCGVIAPMSKWSQTVKSADRLVEMMHKALRACFSDRPGVVHLDVPETIMNGKVDRPDSLAEPSQYRVLRPQEPAAADIQRTMELLAQAKAPALHVGSGAIHAQAYAEVQELAELLHAPITTSWGGRSVVAETHPLVFPIIHIDAVNTVRQQADFLLCLGSDLGETDWWAKPPYWRDPSQQSFIQVDIDPEILGRNHRTDLPVLADLKRFLQLLIAAIKADAARCPVDAERKHTVQRWQAKRDAHRAELDTTLADRSTPMVTAHVADTCQRILPAEAIGVFDGGNTAVWGNFYTRFASPNSQLGTHHFGHLGAGLGQAIGAAVARPEAPVYCMIGDGAMGFHVQDIETAIRHELPIIFLVCCDRQWGMVKLTERIGLDPVRTMVKKALGTQDGEFDGLAEATRKPLRKLLSGALSADKTINADLQETDYAKLAASMGAWGARVNAPDQLDQALSDALASQRCAVIHVDVDAEKHLWAPGLMHFKDMHQEPAGR